MFKKLVKRSRRHGPDDDEPNDRQRISVGSKSSKKPKAKKGAAFLDADTLGTLSSAVAGKHKLSPARLCRVFEQYDTDEAGVVDDTTFAKCIKKLGVGWSKDQLSVVQDCFRVRRQAIDYYSFVDFATSTRDSEKLSAVAAALCEAIADYDKRSGEQPFNMYESLERADKNERGWLAPDVFRKCLTRPVDMELTSKQVNLLLDRFSFEFDSNNDDDGIGVDYAQFAAWLQPSFHYKAKELQKRVQGLFRHAKKTHGLRCIDIFKAVDDDDSGLISRLEFKEALHDLGFPVTDAQIKGLIESVDGDGNGKIDYKEFAVAFGAPSENDDDDDDDDKVKTTKRKNAKKIPSFKALIEPSALSAMLTAVHGKQRKNGLDIAAVFEKYDTHERGYLDAAAFTKGIAKLGIKLKKDHLACLCLCFGVKKKTDAIDYYAFVDYLQHQPDTKQLDKVRSKITTQLRAFDKASGEAPTNLHTQLAQLDTKDAGWIPIATADKFFSDHGGLRLTASEIDTLLERFGYDYTVRGKSKPVTGVDYDQCARWLQPSLHLDVQALHATVRSLFHHAQKTLQLRLKDVFRDIDADESGVISCIELKETLQAMGSPLTDAQVRCLVDEYDTDGDGKINYREFVAAIGEPDDKESKHKKDKSLAKPRSVVL
ncbi:hypothetical protein SPRG_17906, partial [Saprolegnia parasitica CBS 223.65]